jgi:3-phenylpropionate/cinnamic acid dioxygenase small subunit
MTDIDDIQRLIYLHGHVIDDKQWDRLDEVFADDASFEIEGTEISMSGFAAIDEFMRRITHPLAHYSTNVLIDLEDGADVATARVKIFAPRANGTSAVGTYNDVIVRTEKGWRFQRRLVKIADLNWRSAPLQT